MKFCALLSGGKDSCYNAVKCVEHGHELVCLANLLPPADFVGEEMNSFMYQSAAFSAIPALAECFEVPLVRRHIQGLAVVQSLDYEDREQSESAPSTETEIETGSKVEEAGADEVEDLYELLLEVKRQHPDCTGVSCGAIVSTYQRLRLEHVCRRVQLNMVPLCYLWMRDRAELLDEITDVVDVSGNSSDSSSNSGGEKCVPNRRLTAILVKVAGAGLQPYKHLGRTLLDLKPTLLSLHAKFGLDLCGEGGEYETLVSDCSLFPKKKLRVVSSEILEDVENYTVGNYRVLECIPVDKDITPSTADCSTTVHVDANSEVLMAELSRLVKHHTAMPSTPQRELENTNGGVVVEGYVESLKQVQRVNALPESYLSSKISTTSSSSSSSSSCSSSRSFAVSGADGLGHTGLIFSNGGGYSSTAAQQMIHCMSRLKQLLCESGGSLGDVCFIHLYLSDMRSFSSANDAYIEAFQKQSKSSSTQTHKYPPSRSCVCVPLPEGVHVALDAMFYIDSYDGLITGCGKDPMYKRSVLHVQSVSEWAPLCIGPYSQANTIGTCLTLAAGQIPLDPSKMTLLPSSEPEHPNEMWGWDDWEWFLRNLMLSLRHTTRVLKAEGTTLSRSALVTVYVNSSKLSSAEAGYIPAKFVSKIEKFVAAVIQSDCGSDMKLAVETESINSDYNSYPDSDSDSDSGSGDQQAEVVCPAILVVGVHDLPKGAVVEIEIAASGSHFPHNAYNMHYEDCCQNAGCDYPIGAAEPVLPIHTWPIWWGHADSRASVSGASISTNIHSLANVVTIDEHGVTTSAARDSIHLIPPTPPAKPPAARNDSNGCSFNLQCKTKKGCLCAGVVRVGRASTDASTASTGINLDSCIMSLLIGVCRALALADMSVHKLVSLRCYYLASAIAANTDEGTRLQLQLQDAMNEHSVKILGRALPAIFIPVVHLPQSLPGVSADIKSLQLPALIGHVLAVDITQYATQKWILGANNTNDSSGR